MAILVIVIVVILFGVFFVTRGEAEPNEYDEFAKCITNSGAKMYGAYWCSHCKSQKESFGDSWKLINYVECDPKGENANPAECEEHGIKGYPTWIFGDGQRNAGSISLSSLAIKTGCELP